MARLFTCGYEENSLTPTMWGGSTGTAPTIVTTSPHSGTYRMDTAAAVGNSFFAKPFATNKTSGSLFTRVYFQSSTATPSANSRVFVWVSLGPADGPVVEMLTTGAIRLTNGVTSTTTTSSTLLSATTWYRLELRQLVSDAPGASDGLELRLYLGESTTTLETPLTIYNEDNLPTNIATLRVGKTGSSAVFSYDDIAVNDESGTAFNSWPGPGKIAMVVPASSVSVGWQIAGSAPAATNWQGVNELPAAAPDDATAYNQDFGGNGDTDQLGITTLGTGAGFPPADATMICMDIYARVSASASSATMRLIGWNQVPTLINGPTFVVNSTTWRILTTAEHNVLDLTGKTRDNVNNFNIGYATTAGAATARLTTLWANVEWIDASTTTLYLRNTLANGIGSTYYDLSTTAGNASDTAVVTSTIAGTEIQWTKTAGGAIAQWVSGPAPVGGFTLTSSSISIWANEDAAATNIGGRYRIFKRAADTTETELGGGPFDQGVEVATSATEYTWTGDPTDTAFAANDRILLKLYITNIGVMAAGTGTLTFNVASGGTGDSFLSIAPVVVFSPEIPVQVVASNALQQQGGKMIGLRYV